MPVGATTQQQQQEIAKLCEPQPEIANTAHSPTDHVNIANATNTLGTSTIAGVPTPVMVEVPSVVLALAVLT